MIAMGVSKVDYNGETLIDLTGDTVTPATLAEGATAHDMAGNPITGTMKQGSGGEAVKEIEIVSCSVDISTMSVSNFSHTYEQIINALQSGKYCVIRCANTLGAAFGTIAFASEDQRFVEFQLMIYADMGQGFNLYFFRIVRRSATEPQLTVKVVSTVG